MLWWVISKIIGIVMIIAGGFMVVFGPGVIEHQEAGKPVAGYTSFGVSAIVIGLVLVIVGGFILFSE